MTSPPIARLGLRNRNRIKEDRNDIYDTVLAGLLIADFFFKLLLTNNFNFTNQNVKITCYGFIQK
jgi:hypothetical protein